MTQRSTYTVSAVRYHVHRYPSGAEIEWLVCLEERSGQHYLLRLSGGAQPPYKKGGTLQIDPCLLEPDA